MFTAYTLERRRSLRWATAIASFGLCATPPAASAAETAPTKVVVANEDYAAGPIWSLFFGADWRDLWTTPVEVPVLDLEKFAGGLRATKKGGGRQTRSLGFEGANGREYKFRSIDKDPSEALPEELRGGGLEDIAQDQTSSGHPAAALIVEPLARAAGLVQVRWRMVVLPDSPRLGEFRNEFAGMLGTIEDDPESDAPERTPGFEKMARIVETEELYELLQASAAEQVDRRAYLRARLVDFFVGDWDRHQGQWDWGKSEADGLWKPIPKDRDQAFSRYDGFLVRLGTGGRGVTVFKRKYADVIGGNWVARELDRRFFAGLPREEWEAQADDLARRWTDEVLQAAVEHMPREYYAISGAELLRALKARRDALPRIARKWYRKHAEDVDVFATDEAERLEVVQADGGLDVRIVRDGAAKPHFERRFDAGETQEVRVYLAGGADRAQVRGRGRVKLRIVGGDGNDVLDDSEGGGSRFYDAEGENTIRRGFRTRVGTAEWREPEAPKEPRPRDWGASWSTPIWFSAGSEIGVFLGAGLQRIGYGFRRDPFSSRQLLRVGYAFGAHKVRADYVGQFHRVQSRTRVEVFARASGIEIVRFYGFGNETSDGAPDDFFKVADRQYTVLPVLSLPAGRHGRIRVGPRLRYSSSNLRPDRFIGIEQPYGAGRFGQGGVDAMVEWDTRDEVRAPRKGLLARASGSFVPPVGDVDRAFGSVQASTSGVVTADLPWPVTFAGRVGGKQTFGTYPYYEAAFIGGARKEPTVRGLRGNRYAGDAALYANAELRVRLAKTSILVPTELGLFGFGDVGRVFLDGESSNRWHKGVGGGFWIAPVQRRNTFTFSAARSEGRTAFYVHAGFAF